MRIITIVCLFVSYTNCNPNYGPFVMIVTKLDICKGPKNKNCTVLTPTLINGTKLSMNVEVTENCQPSKGKIVASSNGKELVRLQMNKPCEHFFLRPLFENLFKVTKTCVILKGNYSCELDINEISSTYTGGKFYYGNMTYKSIVYGNKCNFACSILHVTIIPKK